MFFIGIVTGASCALIAVGLWGLYREARKLDEFANRIKRS